MPGFRNLLLALITLFILTASALPPAQTPQQAISPPQPQHGQTSLGPKHPKIRNATLADLPYITKTFDDAFKAHSTWHYIYQFADQYPNYHEYCLSETVREGIEATLHSAKGVIKVITVPDEDDDGHSHGEKVVSAAVWQFIDEMAADLDFDTPTAYQRSGLTIWSNLNPLLTDNAIYTAKSKDPIPDQPPFNCTLHLDANTTRQISILSQESAAITQYISPTYSTRLYLALLATHPDYDGHGYAAAHVELGLTWAAERGLPVALLATPAGYPVYKAAGFQDVENVTIEFLDGLGGDWEEVMVWTGRGKEWE